MSELELAQYKRNTVEERHWSRQSQPIAPSDILVNWLQCGWKLGDTVKRQIHHYGPGRSLDIYHFTLSRDNEMLELPVGSNPVVKRIISENRLSVVLIS